MIKRVYLEITADCNLSCRFCTLNKKKRYLSLDEIDDYLKQIKLYCDYIYLHVLGEPLLHPDFEKILTLLDKYQFKLQLVTNGLKLADYPYLMKHSCLRKLSISLHSINGLDINDDYFMTIDNLIENNNNKTIELRFYGYDFDEKLIAYKNKLLNKYSIKETKKKNSYSLKENVYFYHDSFFNWPSLNDPFISDNGKCHGALDQIAILSDGTVSICCLDGDGLNKLGNLKKDSLSDILNSPLYSKIINDLKNNKLNFELCKHCSYRLRFGHSNNSKRSN